MASTELAALSKEELIERLERLDGHNVTDVLARAEDLERRLFDADTALEAERMRSRKLEADNKALLTRAMEAEQSLAEMQTAGVKGDAAVEAQRRRLVELEQRVQERADAEAATARALDELQAQLARVSAIAATAETERANAQRNDELRLSTEHALEELSRQYDDLLAQLEGQQARRDAAEAEAAALRDKLAAMEARALAAEAASRTASTEGDALRRQAERDAAARRAAEAEAERQRDELEALRRQLEAQRAKEERLLADAEALRAKAAGWRRDAERATELEVQLRSAQALADRQAREIEELRERARELREALRRAADEAQRARDEHVSAKSHAMLKQQHAELTLKFAAAAEREKGWLKERAELLQRIRRLELELRGKNPSLLRMMEVEVQNQLLLGMLQGGSGGGTAGSSKHAATSSGASGGGRKGVAPRKLPPLSVLLGDGNDGDNINNNTTPLRRSASTSGAGATGAAAATPAATSASIDDNSGGHFDMRAEPQATSTVPPHPSMSSESAAVHDQDRDEKMQAPTTQAESTPRQDNGSSSAVAATAA